MKPKLKIALVVTANQRAEQRGCWFGNSESFRNCGLNLKLKGTKKYLILHSFYY